MAKDSSEFTMGQQQGLIEAIRGNCAAHVKRFEGKLDNLLEGQAAQVGELSSLRIDLEGLRDDLKAHMEAEAPPCAAHTAMVERLAKVETGQKGSPTWLGIVALISSLLAAIGAGAAWLKEIVR